MTPLLQLRTFLEVYRTGSISRAAAHLGITQPAASGHIKSIEAQTERQLFQRNVKGVRPTEAAHELARMVGPGLDDLEVSYSLLRARTAEPVGRIGLAGPPEFMRAQMPSVIVELTGIGYSVRVTLGGREQIYSALRNGDADVAITASRPRERAFGYEKIREEVLVPVASPQWLATHTNQDDRLIAAAQHAPIAYDDDLPLIATVLERIDMDLANVHPAVTVSNLRMVRDLVEHHAGWSVIPDYLISRSLEIGQLVKLRMRSSYPSNTLFLTWRKSSLREPRVAQAREHILDALSRAEA